MEKEIKQKVIELCRELSVADDFVVTGETTMDDLYFDSLDGAELAVNLEKMYDVNLYEEVSDFSGSTTIDDIVSIVERKRREKVDEAINGVRNFSKEASGAVMEDAEHMQTDTLYTRENLECPTYGFRGIMPKPVGYLVHEPTGYHIAVFRPIPRLHQKMARIFFGLKYKEKNNNGNRH